MTNLPVVSGMDIVKALRKIGYEFHHQKGSHIILKLSSSPYTRISIPNHKIIKKGLLRAIIRETGLSREEFMKLLE